MNTTETSPLQIYAHIFDFRWSRFAGRALREQEIVAAALTGLTYDLERLVPNLAHFHANGFTRYPRIRVSFTTIGPAGLFRSLPDIRITRDVVVAKSFLKTFGYSCGVFLHEVGHAVDFLTLNSVEKRDRVLRAFYGDNPARRWEGGRYRRRGMEMFADAWADIYSDAQDYSKNKWARPLTAEAEQTIREVCG